MAWRIQVELDSGGDNALITGLSRLDWLRLETEGARVHLSMRPADHRRAEAVRHMLAEVTAYFPHAVSIDGSHPRPTRGTTAVRDWLGARPLDAFAVFSYGWHGEGGRDVFCFRRSEDAFHFGRRFL